jgi:uncharacterized integral membrane protein (TIGR00697 family)
MYNELIFLIHVLVVAGTCLACLALGSHALVASVAIQGILSNLFITKQITLLGLHITCSDAYAVGSILSLNLLQEYYGKSVTKKAIYISFFCVFSYLIFSQIHLLYIPNQFDSVHSHFFEILQLMPRITLASIFVYLIVQSFDAMFFGFLKNILNNKYPALRSATSMAVSQMLDTILFTFLALYGVVESVLSVIVMSFAIKILVIAIFTPFIKLARIFNANKDIHS